MPPRARRAGAGRRAGAAAARRRAGAAGADAAGAAARPAPRRRGRRSRRAAAAAGGGASTSTQFYQDEGVLALFDRGGNSDMAAGGSDLTWQQQRPDGGTIFVQSGGSPTADPPHGAAAGHARGRALQPHGAAARAQRAGEGRAEHRDATFGEETPAPNGFNVVGEIPGTDKADEIVLIGAHFDSWHGGTGATDNAAGSAAMMEVLRILKATGLQPRRTVRIGLWGAEEGGLARIARRTCASTSARAQAPKPELAKTSRLLQPRQRHRARFAASGCRATRRSKPIFEAWIAPLKDLGVEILGPRSVSQTDHTSFDARRRAGVSVRAGALRVQLAHAPLEHGRLRSRAGRGHEADRDGRRRLRLAGGESGRDVAEEMRQCGSEAIV